VERKATRHKTVGKIKRMQINVLIGINLAENKVPKSKRKKLELAIIAKSRVILSKTAIS
jgi:hypothetical protein